MLKLATQRPSWSSNLSDSVLNTVPPICFQICSFATVHTCIRTFNRTKIAPCVYQHVRLRKSQAVKHFIDMGSMTSSTDASWLLKYPLTSAFSSSKAML
jgi:hypothetical protein